EDDLTLADEFRANEPLSAAGCDYDVGVLHDLFQRAALPAHALQPRNRLRIRIRADFRLHAIGEQEAGYADSGCPEPDLANDAGAKIAAEVAGHAQKRGERHDGRAVLVIVHDRDGERFDERPLDLEAGRR